MAHDQFLVVAKTCFSYPPQPPRRSPETPYPATSPQESRNTNGSRAIPKRGQNLLFISPQHPPRSPETPWPKPAPSRLNTPLRYWLFSIQPEKTLLPSAAKWVRRRSGDNSTTAPFTSWSCIFVARPHGLLRIGLIDRMVFKPTRSPRDFPETSVVQRYLPLFSQGHGRPCPDNGATAFESAAKVSDARAGRPPQHDE